MIFMDAWGRLSSGNLMQAFPVALLLSFMVAALATVFTRPR